MQGQSSLSEALDFNHGSASSSSSINQQYFWGDNTLSSAESFPEYTIVDDEPNFTHLNPFHHNGHNMVPWAIGESSSSIVQNDIGSDELKVQHDWPSSLISSSLSGSALGEQQCDPKNFLSSHNVDLFSDQMLAGQSLHGISSNNIPQNISNSSSIVLGKNGFPSTSCPHPYSFPELGIKPLTSASSSSHPVTTCPKSGIMISGIADKPGSSLDDRRLLCKRKAVEATLGQSSAGPDESSQHHESNLWCDVSALNGAGSSCRLSTVPGSTTVDPPVEVDSNLSIGIGTAPEIFPSFSENTHRNVRLRLNPPQQLNLSTSTPPTLQFLPLNPCLPQLGLMQVADTVGGQSNSHIVHAHTLAQNIEQPVIWNEASRSRPVDPSCSLVSGVRGVTYQEESGRTNTSGVIRETLMSTRSSVQRNHAQYIAQNLASLNLTGTRMNNGGIMVSNLPVGSSGAHAPPPTPARTLHPYLQHRRRILEIGRCRSISSVANGSGSTSYGQSALRLDSPATSQEMVAPAVTNRVHRHPYTRASLLDRQNDVLLIPQSTVNDGRRRLASEIRSLLDIVRGREVRVEDLMRLEQSGIFGSSDSHDRYRDMRLDVDNMSYEELLALGERIGNVSIGLSEETILKHMKLQKFQSSLLAKTEAGMDEPCTICQEKYEGGEVGVLDCGHGYHSECIKKWLMQKNLCPICKTTGLGCA